MTEEQQRLCGLIDGHCAAMKAQVEKPDARLQFLTAGGQKWMPVDREDRALFGNTTVYQKCWRRLAPAPKLVPLDQSDFLGEGRVTHLRMKGCISVSLVIYCDEHGVYLHNSTWMAYDNMDELECSRDNGASFGPCSRPERPSA